MAVDFKKTDKELYQAKTTPVIIDVPEMLFIAVDGKGEPNTSQEYADAISALYSLAYTIKMNNKSVLEYVVPPLEGFWQVNDENFWGGGASITDKSKFEWTMVIRQPDFVNEDIFTAARELLARKKPELDTSKVRLVKIKEGLCAQVLHVGSYDDEPKTVALLNSFAVDKGYEIDISDIRRHHEIYLSDPRKVAAEKLKTIIRHPVKEAK